jgi:Flp pilus assembly protein TadD
MKKSRTKPLLFFLVLTLGPFLLLMLATEGLLRAAGFGYPTAPLLRVSDDSGAHWVGNPDFTRLYFPAALKRLPPPVRVAVDKPAGTRRYLVVGGSAAAGDPDTDFSIARNLEWILTAAHPGRGWEVINLAYTACNSHVAAEVVRQSAPWDLDGVIVLVGNNEVIGPFGPGTALGEQLPGRSARAWQIRLRKTRLGQLGQILRESMAAGDAPETWRGMRHFLEHRIAADDPRLQQVYSNFQHNLEDIERVARRRGIPVLLATVPVNLLDQPPFHDAPDALPPALRDAVNAYLETGRAPLELPAAREAAAAHPRSAALAYMTGRLLFEAGEPGKAAAELRRARDLDQLRFRADGRVNALIRDQWRREGAAWIGVDAAAPLVADHPRGALGFPHFYEHVHFSFRANFLIAREMATALLTHENLATEALAALDWSQAAAGLAYTPYEAWRILEEIERRFGEPPFTGIPGYGRATAWMDTLRQGLLERVSRAEEKARLHEAYLAASRARPQDDRIRAKLAGFLAAFGQEAAAFDIISDLAARHPTDSDLAVSWFSLALQNGDRPRAAAALERIRAIFPGHPNLPAFREQLAALP